MSKLSNFIKKYSPIYISSVNVFWPLREYMEVQHLICTPRLLRTETKRSKLTKDNWFKLFHLTIDDAIYDGGYNIHCVEPPTVKLTLLGIFDFEWQWEYIDCNGNHTYGFWELVRGVYNNSNIYYVINKLNNPLLIDLLTNQGFIKYMREQQVLIATENKFMLDSYKDNCCDPNFLVEIPKDSWPPKPIPTTHIEGNSCLTQL